MLQLKKTVLETRCSISLPQPRAITLSDGNNVQTRRTWYLTNHYNISISRSSSDELLNYISIRNLSSGWKRCGNSLIAYDLEATKKEVQKSGNIKEESCAHQEFHFEFPSLVCRCEPQMVYKRQLMTSVVCSC